jgi:hypothetical protein
VLAAVVAVPMAGAHQTSQNKGVSRNPVPQNVVDVESGKAPSVTGSASPAADNAGSGSGDDDSDASLIVAIAALVTAALGVALLARPRRRAT